MFEPLTDLSKARILVTNDDGITAPGIRVLEKVARSLSPDVWVCAPESEQSAVAHSLTIRRPLRLRKVSRRRYSVDGTPTDCVFLAYNHLFADKKPDLVLSGINRGGNLADDVTYSGTVAAAMEGTILGLRSIALSQVYVDGSPIHWGAGEHHAAEVVRKLAATAWPKGVLMNVNFPAVGAAAVAGVSMVRQGKRPCADELSERIDPRGETYFWIGAQRTECDAEDGTDLDAVRRGRISVTPLHVDLTHRDCLARLAGLFP